MSPDKKGLSPFKPYLERGIRTVALIWWVFIAIGCLTTYLRPLLPWIAGAVVIAVTTWIIIAVVRWRRSKW